MSGKRDEAAFFILSDLRVSEFYEEAFSQFRNRIFLSRCLKDYIWIKTKVSQVRLLPGPPWAGSSEAEHFVSFAQLPRKKIWFEVP